MHELDDRSEDVELHLLVSGVADAHRAAAEVAVQRRQHGLGQELVAGDGVERPQLLGLGDVLDALAQPVKQCVGLVGAAEADER